MEIKTVSIELTGNMAAIVAAFCPEIKAILYVKNAVPKKALNKNILGKVLVFGKDKICFVDFKFSKKFKIIGAKKP